MATQQGRKEHQSMILFIVMNDPHKDAVRRPEAFPSFTDAFVHVRRHDLQSVIIMRVETKPSLDAERLACALYNRMPWVSKRDIVWRSDGGLPDFTQSEATAEKEKELPDVQ